MRVIKSKKYAQSKEADALISILQSYIDFINKVSVYEEAYKNSVAIAFFEQIIEGIQVEKVLYDKLTQKGFGNMDGKFDRDVIQHLQGLTLIPNGSIDEQKNFIKNIYETYCHRDHPVRSNLFFMDSIPEVNEWMDKNSKFREIDRYNKKRNKVNK